jgi:hypothetical protein
MREFDPVILESHSLELVHLWNKRRAIQELAPLFSDVEDLAASFSSFSVVHARRTANLAAHSCASSSEFKVWANSAR